jgi:NAD(P)-dependent dehydrogenase (short-subunit alcohol dehydrogenase family)
MDLGIKGRRALVTGASRGIGRATAELLAEEGASVAICARGAQGVEDAVEALRAKGVQAYGEAFDVRDGQALQGFVQRAHDALGGLDIVVGNASTRPDSTGEARWRDAFEADLLQHVRVLEATLPLLKGGDQPSLVFIGSIAAVMKQLLPEEVAYGAFKAGLLSYAGHMAERCGAQGIRVNTVSPGPIYFEGGAWDAYRRDKPKLYEAVLRMSALGRLGTPEDVARAVVFLASPMASYITGANLRVDGGTLKQVNF